MTPIAQPRLPREVLLVEDDPVQLRVWDSLARRYGISLTTTSRTTEVLRLAMTVRPSLIVLDLLLEDGQSLRVLKCLRESAETRDIPVVIISGYLSAEVELAIEALGDVAFLQKPWELQELLPFIAKAARPLVQPQPLV